METFADVLHEIIDVVLHGDAAGKAHAIIDQASGQRTPAPEPDPAAEPAPDAASDAASDVPSDSTDVPGDPNGTTVPGA